MPLTIIRHDITKLSVDAIVNAANTLLERGGGVCGAIFEAAGIEAMTQACQSLAPISTGQAVLTPGFDLPAKVVIHAVGPIYTDGKHGEAELLRQTYLNSLELAVREGCESIAFPLISSGIYGYPSAEALAIAMSTFRAFLKDHELDITLVVFNRRAFELSEALLGDIESFIDEHYIDERQDRYYRRRETSFHNRPLRSQMERESTRYEPIESLDGLLDHLDESFSEALFRLIDQKKLQDPDVYKKANIDRKHFSKIRSNRHYMPSKPTAVALAIALELNLSETEAFLRKAGFALSPSSKFDVLITYVITHKITAIDEINTILFSYDQPLLGV